MNMSSMDCLIQKTVLNEEKIAYLKMQETDPYIRSAIGYCTELIDAEEKQLRNTSESTKKDLLKTYMVRFIRTPDIQGSYSKKMRVLLNQMKTASILNVLEHACIGTGLINTMLLKGCAYGELGTILNKKKTVEVDTELLNRSSRQDLINDFVGIVQDFSQEKKSQTLRNRLSSSLYRDCVKDKWSEIWKVFQVSEKHEEAFDFLSMKDSNGQPLYTLLGIKEILPMAKTSIVHDKSKSARKSWFQLVRFSDKDHQVRVSNAVSMRRNLKELERI